MTLKTAETVHPEMVAGDWVVRFEKRTLADVRTIVQPTPENERRFAAARRVSEINLGFYRSFFQPFVRAFASDQSVEALRKLSLAELPYELFSVRNPLMGQVAQLAAQVREHRQPVSPDNPLLRWQSTVSDGIITALDSYRDLRDRSAEQLFLWFYGSPHVQTLLGIGPSDEPPRRRPGVEPERRAFIQQGIAELKAHIAEGGLREAAIRSMIYICMAGPGVDERAFNELRHMRATEDGIALEEFKRLVREQFFTLLLDRDAALAAIPKMLKSCAGDRAEALETIRQVVAAVGEPDGERTERLAHIEKLFDVD
jgi:hypothetical protein